MHAGLQGSARNLEGDCIVDGCQPYDPRTGQLDVFYVWDTD